jgi:hypothetical protein
MKKKFLVIIVSLFVFLTSAIAQGEKRSFESNPAHRGDLALNSTNVKIASNDISGSDVSVSAGVSSGETERIGSVMVTTGDNETASNVSVGEVYYFWVLPEYTFTGLGNQAWLPMETDCPNRSAFSASATGSNVYAQVVFVPSSTLIELLVLAEFTSAPYSSNITVSSGGCVSYTRSCFITQPCYYNGPPSWSNVVCPDLTFGVMDFNR